MIVIRKIDDLCAVFGYYTHKCIIHSNKNGVSLKKIDDNCNNSKMNNYYLQSFVKYIGGNTQSMSIVELLNDLHEWFVYQMNKIINACNMFNANFFKDFVFENTRCSIFSNDINIWYQFRLIYDDITFEEFINTDYNDLVNYIKVSNPSNKGKQLCIDLNDLESLYQKRFHLLFGDYHDREYLYASCVQAKMFKAPYFTLTQMDENTYEQLLMVNEEFNYYASQQFKCKCTFSRDYLIKLDSESFWYFLSQLIYNHVQSVSCYHLYLQVNDYQFRINDYNVFEQFHQKLLQCNNQTFIVQTLRKHSLDGGMNNNNSNSNNYNNYNNDCNAKYNEYNSYSQKSGNNNGQKSWNQRHGPPNHHSYRDN